MSSAFERLQKLAEEKRQKAQADKPKFEVVPPQNTQPAQPIIGKQPDVPNLIDLTDSDKHISPENDYTKVANSIARQAVPERFFKGMSKNTYDALYSKTRGAINPVRRIRATKSDLLRWTGVSDVTIDKHIRHLKSVGLIKVEFVIGSHEGNWYEVFIPEEIPNQPNQPNQPNIPKKVGGQVPNFLGYVGWGELLENKGVSDSLRLKKDSTKNDDDKTRVREAFSVLAKRLDAAAKKITGKGVSKSEAEKWGTFADLLILELEVAASRADGVSSVPAFLTEVLRRQFFAARQQQAFAKPSKTKPDTVGKSDSESYEIKPLDAPGRKAALVQLREFAADDFLEDFAKWYTAEDWTWLIDELRK